MVSHQLGSVSDYVSDLVIIGGPGEPLAIGPRQSVLTSERLSHVYKCPIAVRSVDGHAAIFVEDKHSDRDG